MNTCRNPKDLDETTLTIEDIRQKVKDLTDVDSRTIGLDLLDHATNLQNQLDEKDSIIKDLQSDKQRLLEANNALFLKSSAFIDNEDTVKGASYDNIDRDKSKIIDDIIANFDKR